MSAALRADRIDPLPRAARDVAPGERWTFAHRSMAEVVRAEAAARRDEAVAR
ncbi:MAG: hypothetical protein JO021_21990 [Alphaproteobacteria bacterium]|nr:hypothetical protein [Alphaproteobacteria bacterium]